MKARCEDARLLQSPIAGSVPTTCFSLVLLSLYQVARLFHFASSLDLREGQVTPPRGMTNSKLIQNGGEARQPLLPCSPGGGSEAGVSPTLTPV